MESQFSLYWKSIILRAWKRAVEKFGWFGIILDLLVAAIVTWITKYPKSLADVGRSEVFLAVGAFIGIFLIILVIFIFTEPPIYDNEKNELLSKWEAEIIKTDKIIISAREGAWNKDRYIWLNIENHEVYDLRDCYVTLKEVLVKQKKFDRWLNFERQVIENTNKLTWPSLAEDEKIVRRHNSERVNIAKLEDNEIFFTLGDGDRKVLDFIPFQLYVEVSLNGELNGKQIEEKTIRGFLIVEFNQQIHMVLGPRFYLLEKEIVQE